MKKSCNNLLNNIRNYYSSYIFLFIIVFIISLIYLNSSPLYKNILPDIDSSVFQVMGKGMIENKIIYKNLFDHKGPIVYIINAIAFIINNKYGLFIMELIIAYIGTIFVHKTAKIMLSKKISIIMSIIYIFISFKYLYGGNFTEEYAITFISIAMYYIIKILHKGEKNKKLNWIIIGITFAITFFIKPTYCTIWAVFGLVQLICSIKDKKIKELIKAIGYMIFGMLIVSIPIIIYLAVNGAIDAFIDAYFLMNIKYSKSTIIQKIYGLLELLIIHKYFIYFLLMEISNVAILMFQKINKRTNIFVTLFFIISVILTGWSPTAYNHYLIQLAPCFTLEIIIFIYTLNQLVKEKDILNLEIIKTLTSKFIVKMITIPVIFLISVNLIVFAINMKNKDYYYEDLKNSVIEINNYIGKDDEILVLGNNSYYYLLFSKQPKFKYFFQYPIIKYDETIKDETEKYIIEKKPKIIIDEHYKNATKFGYETFEQIHGKELLEKILKSYEEHNIGIIKYYVLKEKNK